MDKHEEIFISIVNATYDIFFGHVIMSENSKQLDAVANLVAKLNLVPLLRGDTREVLYQFYIDTICSSYIRTSSFGPQVSHIVSDRTFDRITLKYKELKSKQSILTASTRFIKETGVRSVIKHAGPGRYFGYKWDDIKAFTNDSSLNLMGKLLVQMKHPTPSLYFITLLDGLIFYKLGNNYQEESKEQKGWVNPEAVRTSYREIKKLLDCRNRFIYQRQLLESTNIMEAFGYKKTTVRVINKEATYTDIQVWLNIVNKNNKQIPLLSSYFQIDLEVEERLDRLKYILLTQKQKLLAQLRLSKANLTLFKQILLLIEFPETQAKLKGLEEF